MATVFEKTWKTIANWPLPSAYYASVAQATAYYCWWLSRMLKNAALGQATNPGAWAVEYSCDSVTAGTAGDGIDRWGDVFDTTKVVQGIGATAVRSWMVMSKTINGTKWYCCIEVGTANTGGAAYNVACFFSNNAFTGGTTQVRPTSTTEFGFGNPSGSGIGANTPAMQYDCNNSSTTTVPHKLHGNLSTDGNWMFYVSKDGNGAWCASTAFGAFSTISGNVHAGDACPAWAFHYSDNGGGSTGRTPWATQGFSDMTTFSGITTVNCMFIGRDAANSKIVPFVALKGPGYGGGFVFALLQSLQGSDSADGYYDDLPICLIDAVNNSLRTRITDIAYAPQALPQGAVEPPGAATYSSIVIGNSWHPWITSATPAF